MLGSLICILLLWSPVSAAAVTDSGRSKDDLYVHSNGAVHMLSARGPNDPQRPKQAYLDQIGAAEAWKSVTESTGLTIALIDTGVDLDHPDLKDNLIPGINLIKPGSAPEDDNGHGTNVAGVLAAVGNNGTGTTGLLWKARIMPIKALDRDGNGDEERLGEAVMYAVKHGAKIVVLSVGLYRYSPYLRDIAAYAEKKGVLLVAASGNDGLLHGSKAEVTYPAAYPTVLAVGGVKPDGEPDERSNPGSEIDVAAPWNVYTTAIGGGYKADQGTSMAAPQAAAVAAMLWTEHPDWKPYQIREVLRRTAKDIGPAGRDTASGYGLLQADKAVSARWVAESPEAGETKAAAKIFPLNKRLAGALSGGADRDWYEIVAPYDGTITVSFQPLLPQGAPMPPVRIMHAGGTKGAQPVDMKIGSKAVDWTVSKGKSYIGLQFDDRNKQAVLPYLLTAEFQIARDKYESNDKPSDAWVLDARSQFVTGTFHQTGDRDWYAVTFARGGTLKLSVDTDSMRIDPGLSYRKEGDSLKSIDYNGEGGTERSPAITVTPGRYLICVYNAAAEKASPVAASYKLALSWVTRYDDPNEPNNAANASTVLKPDTSYPGTIGRKGDTDWYRFASAEPGQVMVKLMDIPPEMGLEAAVYDKQMRLHRTIKGQAEEMNRAVRMTVDRGVYYIKVHSAVPFDSQYYRISVHPVPETQAAAGTVRR